MHNNERQDAGRMQENQRDEAGHRNNDDDDDDDDEEEEEERGAGGGGVALESHSGSLETLGAGNGQGMTTE